MRSFLLTSLLTLIVLIPLGFSYVSIHARSDKPTTPISLSTQILGRVSFVAAMPAIFVFVYADELLNQNRPFTFAIPFLFAWLFWTFFVLLTRKIYRMCCLNAC